MLCDGLDQCGVHGGERGLPGEGLHLGLKLLHRLPRRIELRRQGAQGQKVLVELVPHLVVEPGVIGQIDPTDHVGDVVGFPACLRPPALVGGKDERVLVLLGLLELQRLVDVRARARQARDALLGCGAEGFHLGGGVIDLLAFQGDQLPDGVAVDGGAGGREQHADQQPQQPCVVS